MKYSTVDSYIKSLANSNLSAVIAHTSPYFDYHGYWKLGAHGQIVFLLLQHGVGVRLGVLYGILWSYS